jgi:hypothetical protein
MFAMWCFSHAFVAPDRGQSQFSQRRRDRVDEAEQLMQPGD